MLDISNEKVMCQVLIDKAYECNIHQNYCNAQTFDGSISDNHNDKV